MGGTKSYWLADASPSPYRAESRSPSTFASLGSFVFVFDFTDKVFLFLNLKLRSRTFGSGVLCSQFEKLAHPDPKVLVETYIFERVELKGEMRLGG